MTPRPRAFYSPWVLWIVWLLWLPFLAPNIIHLVKALGSATGIVALAGNAVFVFVYCLFTFRMALKLSGRTTGDGESIAFAVTAVLLLLCVGVEILGNSLHLEPISLYTYTVAYAGTAFGFRRGIGTNAAVLGVALVVGAILGVPFILLLQTIFLLIVVTFMTMNWTRSIVVSRKLHEAQNEIARMAASEERLRIARDLHDLLGQKLSYIALKSELARQLVDREPERARVEIAEVGSAVRSTLQDIRETVAGYSTPELSRELRLAAQLLSAAGIRLSEECDPALVARLAPAANEAFAWAVREGVTNLVRHSRARTCAIRLRQTISVTAMEIVDDGRGSSGAEEGAHRRGSGLRGLRERFAELGGACSVASGRGGFVLTATIPAEGVE